MKTTEANGASVRTATKPSRLALGSAVLATWLIYGSTYLAVRFAIQTIPPLVTAGTRLLLAGSLLFLHSYLRGFRPTVREWRGALTIGALYFLGSHGLLYWAEQVVASGLAAVLMATEPLVIALILITTGKERFSVWTFVGLVCGIGGVAYLVGGNQFSQHSQMLGCVALIASSMLWAIGVCYSPHAGLPRDPFASAAMTMLAGAVLLLLTAAVFGEFGPGKLNHVSLRSALGLLYVIVFGSLIAFSSYVWLLVHVSPTLVSTHTFVNPVVAVILGWAFAGEPLGWRLFIAMAAILSSIAFIRRGTHSHALE